MFTSMILETMDKVMYTILVMTVFAIIYLGVEYMIEYQFLKSLTEKINQKNMENLRCLHTEVQPKKQEQALFVEILEKINESYQQEVDKFYCRQKEYEKYIETWVHEIKTPIAASRLIIEKNPFDENLISIEEEVDKIEDFVDQALYYAKKDSISKDYFIGEIALEKIIKNVLKKNAKQIIERDISIIREDLNYTVMTDAKWTEFMVNQIMQNAIKYTKKNNGTIKIYGKYENNVITLNIEDNGVGIKEEDLGRVFEKGFTGYTGRIFKKSTGIGLYLVKELSEKLGQKVVIESEYGKYTKVKIHFLKKRGIYDITKL
ncbi:sensor histidine kinase [Clostridium ganghwense]|uniref:histidine kinase n=1 Tax=Clostridium ganghwense TaxID=312089 RepID=A0ABT4CSM6_9CLOT|nr:sensor histidine kinase [Clostridium ganghwense]